MLTTPLLLVASATAAHLELELRLPGADPVWLRVEDVVPGNVVEVPIDARGGKDYRVTAEVVGAPAQDDPLWQVAFRVESVRGKRSELLLQPTMAAKANEPATFRSGVERPNPAPGRGRSADAEGSFVTWAFDGTTIDWVVRDR